MDDKPVKMRGRGGKYNFPSAVPPEDPTDIGTALKSCMHWYTRGLQRPQSDDDIQERTIEFLNYCIDNNERPTVEKYALCMGIDRVTLWKWEAKGGVRGNIIKNAKEFIASYDAEMVSKGKLNPVPYIFRAKNYYGMSDKTELEITPHNPIAQDIDPETIAAEYNALPED